MKNIWTSLRHKLSGTTLMTYSPLTSALMLLPFLLIIFGVFIYPVVKFLLISFGEQEFTLDYFIAALTQSIYLKVLLRTMYIALIVSGINLVLGYPVAYTMAKLNGWKLALVAFCVFIPLWTSVLVRSYVWTVLFQRNGIINSFLQRIGMIDKPLELLYTEGAVIIATTHVLLPFMILPIFNAIRGIAQELPKAAQSLGAGKIATFRHVVLPLSLPGVAGGFLITYILTLGFFITPALLGGPRSMTISMLIQQQVTLLFDWPFAAALSVILLVITLLFVFAFNRIVNLREVLGGGR